MLTVGYITETAAKQHAFTTVKQIRLTRYYTTGLFDLNHLSSKSSLSN